MVCTNKRLLFGIIKATDKFQKILSQVLAGLEGVYSLHDVLKLLVWQKKNW